MSFHQKCWLSAKNEDVVLSTYTSVYLLLKKYSKKDLAKVLCTWTVHIFVTEETKSGSRTKQICVERWENCTWNRRDTFPSCFLHLSHCSRFDWCSLFLKLNRKQKEKNGWYVQHYVHVEKGPLISICSGLELVDTSRTWSLFSPVFYLLATPQFLDRCQFFHLVYFVDNCCPVILCWQTWLGWCNTLFHHLFWQWFNATL